MLQKLFNFRIFCAFFSLACLFQILLYGKDGSYTFSTNLQEKSDEKSTFSPVDARLPNFWAIKTKNSTTIIEVTQTNNTDENLTTCPELPPNLVGALRVEFNYSLTMDDVRRKVSGSLQQGGRYKPSDCISRQKVAIIIPFRNRHEHLKQWLFYLHPILMRQQLDYGVYVINQDGNGVFNRAKLMNIGHAEALKEYDYDCFVFSDVDLVPLNDRNLYRCFNNPRHLAVGMDKFNFHLPYTTFFGGVSSLSKQQYLKINGFPNTYWGWGGEDDDIYKRIIFHKMAISRPGSLIGKYKMIKHRRDLHNEANPNRGSKLKHTHLMMDKDGINSLTYTVKGISKDTLYTFITVDVKTPSR